MKVSRILALMLALITLSLPACNMHAEGQHHEEHQKIVVTSPLAKDVVVTQQYVCQIRSQRHIEVRALEEGYLEQIAVKEGQSVHTDQELFKVRPALYKAKLDAELAEAQFAKVELINTKRLREQKVVSDQEVALYEAKLAKAEAKAKLAEAELNFATVKAPFNGIIDRLQQMQGSLVGKGDLLTTLSDNSVMWVYFNVPEARYLEDMAGVGHDTNNRQIELVLADGRTFPQACANLVREAKFNNETGNIAYRADFPNPTGLLRYGQTGNILIHRTVKNAIVIPQRATFEVLDKRYVYVIDQDKVIHQREIIVEHEMDDVFIIKKLEQPRAGQHKAEQPRAEHKGEHDKGEHTKAEQPRTEHTKGLKGLDVNERIVLEGVRQVHEGEKLEEYEFRKPEEALANQKYHAE